MANGIAAKYRFDESNSDRIGLEQISGDTVGIKLFEASIYVTINNKLGYNRSAATDKSAVKF